eukprot:217457-Hanusia_phi.AAC.1
MLFIYWRIGLKNIPVEYKLWSFYDSYPFYLDIDYNIRFEQSVKTETFTYDDARADKGLYTWNVPSGVSEIIAYVWGAGGGGGGYSISTVDSGGGGGGYVKATIDTQNVSSVNLIVGQGGGQNKSATNAFGGGGRGGTASGGGGGGFSAVFLNDENFSISSGVVASSSEAMVISAGGGGAAGDARGARKKAPGGGGGIGTLWDSTRGTLDNKGRDGGTSSLSSTAGKGGKDVFSNNFGDSSLTDRDGENGQKYRGGDGDVGDDGSVSASPYRQFGGGGGAGWFGGGGGGVISFYPQEAGGGSSYWGHSLVTLLEQDGGDNGSTSTDAGGSAGTGTGYTKPSGIGDGGTGPTNAGGNGFIAIQYTRTLYDKSDMLVTNEYFTINNHILTITPKFRNEDYALYINAYD